jgi:hypothetical protein
MPLVPSFEDGLYFIKVFGPDGFFVYTIANPAS